MNDLVSLSFAILLPMAPAYVCYKILSSTAKVDGPFQSLKLRLSGSFAGYFLVLLLAMGFISTRPERIASRYEVWEVKGKINWDEGGGAPDPQRLRLSLVPANQTVLSDGSFDIQIAPEVLAKDKLKFPTLVIEHPDFQTISIDLNESQGRFGQQVKNLLMDGVAKRIAVSDAIDLKKKLQLPPYAPSSFPPEQTTLSRREVQQ